MTSPPPPAFHRYRLAVLNLVAFGRPYQHVAGSPLTSSPDDDNAPLGTPAIEDWLWQALWFATAAEGQDAATALATGGGGGALGDDGGGAGSSGLTLAQLQGVVAQHPAQFHAPENPFRYASCLLAVGRFGDAVNLLWAEGCADEAVHLALGLHFHGALPVDYGPGAGGGGAASGGGGGGPGPGVPLARYLRAFAARFAATDFHAAFEYLVQLDLHCGGLAGPAASGGGRGQEPAQAAQAAQALSDGVGELLLATNCHAALCGFVTRGGGALQRQRALLYLYLPDAKAQAVVRAAAAAAEQQGLAPQAVDLYRLAGAWAELVNVVGG
jgi:hypothetical protein